MQYTNGRDGPVEPLYTLQEAQAMRLWQPIETAPKDGTRILCCIGTPYPKGATY